MTRAVHDDSDPSVLDRLIEEITAGAHGVGKAP